LGYCARAKGESAESNRSHRNEIFEEDVAAEMPRLWKFGRLGLTLLILNELRGLIVVATILAGWSHAGRHEVADVARLQGGMHCLVVPAACLRGSVARG
jgi:hypothetical protein